VIVFIARSRRLDFHSIARPFQDLETRESHGRAGLVREHYLREIHGLIDQYVAGSGPRASISIAQDDGPAGDRPLSYLSTRGRTL
jgi:hypothetical protein